MNLVHLFGTLLLLVLGVIVPTECDRSQSFEAIAGCNPAPGTQRMMRRKQQLEKLYRQQHEGKNINNYAVSTNKITFLFGHVHHAGGTAICQLARNNTSTNPRDNCNHPNEFKGPPSSPTSGSIAEQLSFQRSTPWLFYTVELKMPKYLKYNGPFIYGVILRNPYLLLMSQYRRSQVKFHFKGDLIDLVHLQLKYVGVTSVDFREHMKHLKQQHSHHDDQSVNLPNFFRGQAGFILGQYGPTNHTDLTIFKMAKRRLRHFSVIALTEFMRQSGIVFEAKFNWNIGDFGNRAVNSNGDSNQLVTDLISLSRDDRDFVSYYANVDIMLYHHAKCLLESAYSELRNATLPLYPYSKVDEFFLLQ